MNINFTKYHGAGNDFLIFLEDEITGIDISDLARKACDRTTGIGADGILICRKDPLSMEIVNSDGSSATMCGNGIRCFSAYCIDEGIANGDTFSIQTDAGEMISTILGKEPFFCEIDMGKPDWTPVIAGINCDDDDDFFEKSIALQDGRSIDASCLFMGTSHTVVWLNEDHSTGMPDIQNEEELKAFGQMLHALPVFPRRTNVNMAMVTGKDEITLRTFERGAGMTAACGTGACATAVVANRLGKSGKDVTVKLLRANVRIRIEESGEVYMTGPAVRIAGGVYSYI